jgi:glycosyltransferase involved in cell wall biosynthesis
LREWTLMRALERRIGEAIASFRPAVVHGHSPVLVAMPALRAAKAAGIPFVYEVRDLWENASVDLGKLTTRSPVYRLARAADTRVLRGAHAVVTICDTLRAEIAPRAGRQSKVFVVDNGVDLAAFDAPRRTADTKGRWNLHGKTVLAYVGTFAGEGPRPGPASP